MTWTESARRPGSPSDHPSSGAPRSALVGQFVSRAALYILLAIIAILCIAPIVMLYSGSLQTARELYRGTTLIPTSPKWENFHKVWVDSKFYVYFLNSVLYSAVAVTATLVISSMAAFAFARLRFRGKNLFLLLVFTILIVPASASFIPLYAVLVKLHLTNTRIGYLLPVISAALPLSIFILQRFFATIPKEIEEAAVLDGASLGGLYFHIMLPLVKPGLAAVAVLTLVSTWNEFLLALVVFRDQSLMPVQQGLVQFNSSERPEQELMLAAAAIAILPVLVAYVVAQKAIIRGVMAGAVRG
ncbi:MAG TPA: carbohydrate ABC transporter permease [Thermomicrobiales bacterium]|nr:carbohydrate ABC transporter permease [Thermomicrobiales bacterium]